MEAEKESQMDGMKRKTLTMISSPLTLDQYDAREDEWCRGDFNCSKGQEFMVAFLFLFIFMLYLLFALEYMKPIMY